MFQIIILFSCKLSRYNKAFFAVSSLRHPTEPTGFEILDPAMNQKASIKGENEIIGGCFPLMEERL